MNEIAEERFNKIYVLGDLHGDYYSLDLLCDKIEENSLIIQVGDWGLGFTLRNRQAKLLKYIQEELEKKNCYIYVIRGNHDDPNLFPQENGRIHFLEDYTYKTINGFRFLFVGGAISVDRNYRVENHTWWRDEGVEYFPDKCKEECDVLIVHSAAESWCPRDSDEELKKVIARFTADIGDWRATLFVDISKERKILEKIFVKTKPKFAFYGHFHFSNKEVVGDCVTKLLHINEYVEFDGNLTYTHDLIENN